MYDIEDKTLMYYNENAEDYVQKTAGIDMSAELNSFTDCLPYGAAVLDLGCGSGRDSRTFQNMGFTVTAVDGSPELCRLASEYAGIPVRCLQFQNLDYHEKFDGIWACASLHHLPAEMLSSVMVKVFEALKPGGTLYTCFKYGDSDYDDEHGRHFTCADASVWKLFSCVASCVDKTRSKTWISGDNMDGRELRWVNILVRKECDNKKEKSDSPSEADKSCPDNVILFPDFTKMENEVKELRSELSELLLERDQLLLIVCPNIETAYLLALGSLEYKAYETQCEALRLKRKVELIQARLNRQEKVIVTVIEKILDDEFTEFKKKLDEQIDKMNDAILKNGCEHLSEEDTKEIKHLYRRIVKALHPDINPDVSESQIHLFANAVNAYRTGDLDTLKIIGEMVNDKPLDKHHENVMTQLAEEKERLQELVISIREHILKIRSEYPYTMKDIINNPEKTEQKKLEFENIIEQYEKMIEIYSSKIDEMLR